MGAKFGVSPQNNIQRANIKKRPIIYYRPLAVNGLKFVHLLDQGIDGDSFLYSNRRKKREKRRLTQEIQRTVCVCVCVCVLTFPVSPTHACGNDTTGNQSLALLAMGSCECGPANVRLLLRNEGVV